MHADTHTPMAPHHTQEAHTWTHTCTKNADTPPHTHAHTNVHTHMHTPTHMHTHTHMHTDTHTHTHARRQAHAPPTRAQVLTGRSRPAWMEATTHSGRTIGSGLLAGRQGEAHEGEGGGLACMHRGGVCGGEGGGPYNACIGVGVHEPWGGLLACMHVMDDGCSVCMVPPAPPPWLRGN